MARGEAYLSYPQRHLFDKLGIRRMLLETDPYGNFLLNGYELELRYMTAGGRHAVQEIARWVQVSVQEVA